VDKLIIKGVGGIDGDYDFDLAEMLSIGSPGALTTLELHRVKDMSKLRAGEIIEAFGAMDTDLLVALAAVVLARRGKRFSDESLWAARMTLSSLKASQSVEIADGLTFVIDEREDEAIPPTEGQPKTPIGEPEKNGGESSSQNSDHQGNGQSPIGIPDLVTHTSVPGSDHRTSET
jgi:hypothetical protein